MNIIVIYDEERMFKMIENKIKGIGYESLKYDCSHKTIEIIRLKRSDVVVLASEEINSEKMFNLIATIRKKLGDTPLMSIVSSNADVSYVQNLLDKGTDACIKGDFTKEEFLLRAQKLLNKKHNLLFYGTTINLEDTSIDIRKHSVYLDKKEVFLTKTEYMILTYLCFHKNSLVRNNDLNFCLGGGKCIKPSYVLNTHVHNLRKKLHGASWLKTITKYGFMVTV